MGARWWIKTGYCCVSTRGDSTLINQDPQQDLGGGSSAEIRSSGLVAKFLEEGTG